MGRTTRLSCLCVLLITAGCSTQSGPSVNLLGSAKQPYYVDRIKLNFATQPDTSTLLPKLTAAVKEIARVPAPKGQGATLVIQMTDFYDTGGAQSLLVGGSNWMTCSVWLRDGKTDKPIYQTRLREANGYALGGIIAAIVEADSDDETALSRAMAARIQRDILDLNRVQIAATAVIQVDTPTVQAALPAAPSSVTPAPSAAAAPLRATTIAPAGASPKAPAPKLSTGTTLAALRATAEATQPKLAAFSGLPDGPLNTETVKALFEGLEVMSQEQEAPMFYSFRPKGRMSGEALGRPPRGNNDDIGTWRITPTGQLCMKWFNWEMGVEHCYGLTKRRDRIALHNVSRPGPLEYQIQN